MAVELATDAEFDSLIGKNEKVIVKYFADWCGSCKLFSPKFKRISNDDKYKEVRFLQVNAENNPAARKKGGVSTLPYFAIFRNGQLVESISTTKEDTVVELIDKLK